jgi:protein-tyrosine phosphatase
MGCGEITVEWLIGIGIAALYMMYVGVSKLNAIVNELQKIRSVLNETESEKYRRKQEEFRNP